MPPSTTGRGQTLRMNSITFNTAVNGVDEASLLIALCFPCEQPNLVKTVDCTSQSRSTPDRLVWRFADYSPSGYTMAAARLAFRLPKRNNAAGDVFQRARLAACNYQALKSALRGAPLTVLEGPNYTLLRNGEGTPVPPLPGAAIGTSSHLPSVAIALALGCRIAAAGRSLDRFHVLHTPDSPVSPLHVESYASSPESEKPDNFSDLAILTAMFKNRAVLMEQVYGRRVVFRNGGRAAIVSGNASEKLADKAYNFIS